MVSNSYQYILVPVRTGLLRNDLDRVHPVVDKYTIIFIYTSRLNTTYFNLLKPTGHVMHQQFNPLKTNCTCVIQGLNAYRAVNTPHFGYKTSQLMQYKAKVAVCSEIHTKHINTM